MTLQFHVISLILLSISYLAGTHFGLPGVSLVLVTVYPLLVIYWLMRTRKLIGYEWRELGRALWPAVVGCIIMLPAVLLTKLFVLDRFSLTLASRVGLTVVAGGISYLGSVLLLSPGTWQQLRAILRRNPIPAVA